VRRSWESNTGVEGNGDEEKARRFATNLGMYITLSRLAPATMANEARASVLDPPGIQMGRAGARYVLLSDTQFSSLIPPLINIGFVPIDAKGTGKAVPRAGNTNEEADGRPCTCKCRGDQAWSTIHCVGTPYNRVTWTYTPGELLGEHEAVMRRLGQLFK